MLTFLVLSSFAPGFARADQTREPLVALLEEISAAEDDELASSATTVEEIRGDHELAVLEEADDMDHELAVLEEADEEDVFSDDNGAALCGQNDNKRDCLHQELVETNGWCIWHGVFEFCEYILDEKDNETTEGSLHEGLNDGDIFQGDIIVDEGVREKFGLSTSGEHTTASAHRRAVTTLATEKWPSRTMPYFFDSSVTSSKRKKIVEALMDISYESGGCIQFKHVTTTTDKLGAVRFQTTGVGCNSKVGKKSLSNASGQINLDASKSKCMKHGVIQHEVLHSLGFYHEQSRTDRDNYVTVNRQNIEGGKGNNFNKEHNSNTQGHPYDYASVMHYGIDYFSNGHGNTLEPKYSSQSWARDVMGQRIGMSALDVEDLKAFYCPASYSSCSGRVRLYNKRNFSQHLGTFYNGSHDLADHGINNKASSVRVDNGCKAILYEDRHQHLDGWSVTLSAGNWVQSDLESLGFQDNTASRLVVMDATASYLPSCSGVTTYSGDQLTGTSSSKGVGTHSRSSSVRSINVPLGCSLAIGSSRGCYGWWASSCHFFTPGQYNTADLPSGSRLYVTHMQVDRSEYH